MSAARPHNTDDTGYSRDGVQAPPLTPDQAFARLVARSVAEMFPPSTPKRAIDAFLDEYRYHTILDARKVFDLLLDLRAEV